MSGAAVVVYSDSGVQRKSLEKLMSVEKEFAAQINNIDAGKEYRMVVGDNAKQLWYKMPALTVGTLAHYQLDLSYCKEQGTYVLISAPGQTIWPDGHLSRQSALSRQLRRDYGS